MSKFSWTFSHNLKCSHIWLQEELNKDEISQWFEILITMPKIMKNLTTVKISYFTVAAYYIYLSLVISLSI